MKNKGQHPVKPKGRWPLFLCGAIHGEAAIAVTGPPPVQFRLAPPRTNPPRKRLPPPTGNVLGMSQGQVWKPAVILALWPEESKTKMTCHNCQTECKRFGKTRQGNQRFRCRTCSKTFSESQPRPLGDMRLSLDRALLCLQLIVEGHSVRSTERITGVHRDTVLARSASRGEMREALV